MECRGLSCRYIIQLVLYSIRRRLPLLGLLWMGAWYSLVAWMMRWKRSGPLVQVNGVGFWLYFLKYRSRKSFKSRLECCTFCVSACLVRMLKKHSIMFSQEARVAMKAFIGARGGNRTRTLVAEKRILSPLRLPVSPPGHIENK